MIIKGTHFNILITGDLVIDWNLARSGHSPDSPLKWNPALNTHASWQRGGAALLADLITAISERQPDETESRSLVFQPEIPTGTIEPGNRAFNHSYAIWSSYPGDKNRQVWRVSEFLGIDPCEGYPGQDENPSKMNTEPDQVHLLIIDDADLGFRNDTDSWPKCLTSGTPPAWILYKMSQPVAQGALWEVLIREFPERLIIVTTVSDLRRTEVQISKGLSWERTAQDVIWELEHNPNVNQISHSAGVVVSFNAAGAILRTANPPAEGENPEIIRKLVFDPKVIEGMWEAQHPGGMIGYTTCLVGGIANQLMASSAKPDLLKGVQGGIKALRDLHRNGYQDIRRDGCPRLAFPVGQIAESLTSVADEYAVVEIQDPVRFLSPAAGDQQPCRKGGFWTIMGDRYRENLEEVCVSIVSKGAEATLRDVPQGVFGYLFTVDRQEIESFRSIRTLVGEYLAQDRPKRPLSIAVFGAPGSGKSFGITQVANSLAPGRIQVLEFNLSQFNEIEELGDALHQVRDINLSGKFPLVFWDEFDTKLGEKPLGWLRYFLAPMQDGAFREGQLVHPIGPAVFVFAGGTAECMSSFGQGLDENASRSAKVPDFISRLKGFVNVLGPNPQDGKGGEEMAEDPYFQIRRAILLRSILQRNTPQLFEKEAGGLKLNIDSGILRAFLNARFFKHGVRSMESIAAMSQLAGKARYERSSLPSETQLDLHVDGQEFLALVQQIDLTSDLLEKLAAAFHEHFCEQLRKQGYEYGSVTNDQKKKHSSLVEYEKLPEHEKEQNRDVVRDIYRKLSRSGYIMIPARSNEPPFEFPGSFLDYLAEMEHNRWMQLKFDDGWEYAPVTDKANKRHADLVPWEKLSEAARDKDREMVVVIPGILAQAGYTVVKMRQMEG